VSPSLRLELNQEFARHEVPGPQSVRLDQHLLSGWSTECSLSTPCEAPGAGGERIDMRDRGPRRAGVHQQPQRSLISDGVGPGLQTFCVVRVGEYGQRDG
jgi:hypothetical protein